MSARKMLAAWMSRLLASMRYSLAAFKTRWRCIQIALPRTPFLSSSQVVASPAFVTALV